ncbi:hypothetical protein HanOQP8_Chr12g0430131 [Helianthus annuus]|nr:hypothetical protein HanLR1_Chr12g0429371 [Helianthus annuus]KAJ0676810.1 hypothetical protein HanOQP8_Chr12g0430131 [Helianthus annuus]
MATYLWRKYADYLHTKWEKEVLWTMVDPFKRPKSFTPLVTIYVSAFYTGVIGAAITEQLYKVLFRGCLDVRFEIDCNFKLQLSVFILPGRVGSGIVFYVT